jgi:hypothetical protein
MSLYILSKPLPEQKSRPFTRSIMVQQQQNSDLRVTVCSRLEPCFSFKPLKDKVIAIYLIIAVRSVSGTRCFNRLVSWRWTQVVDMTMWACPNVGGCRNPSMFTFCSICSQLVGLHWSLTAGCFISVSATRPIAVWTTLYSRKGSDFTFVTICRRTLQFTQHHNWHDTEPVLKLLEVSCRIHGLSPPFSIHIIRPRTQ